MQAARFLIDLSSRIPVRLLTALQRSTYFYKIRFIPELAGGRPASPKGEFICVHEAGENRGGVSLTAGGQTSMLPRAERFGSLV